MKSLIKWMFEVFVMGLIVIVGFNYPFELKASATDKLTVYVQSETLTATTISQISSSSVRSKLQPGDVQVSFCVRNNTGFCNSGMGFDFDSTNYRPIFVSENSTTPLTLCGPVGEGLTILCKIREDTSRIGFASHGDVTYENGIIVSTFLRPITSNPPSNPVTDVVVDMIKPQPPNPDPEPNFEVDEYIYVFDRYFICGDLDDNGVINADDSDIITDALGDLADEIDADNYQEFFDDIPEFDVFDVDGDGDVDDNDAECILSYYVYVEIMGSDPVDCGNVGILIPHFVYVLI